MNLYLTGGAVREHLMGRTPKDFDFAVEAESFEDMRQSLVARGLRIWQERPQFVTLRGNWTIPNGSFDFPRDGMTRGSYDVDFTLCRKETMYSDGRHPDTVTPASLHEDLARRDFTMNAIAVSEHGVWYDPFQGRAAIANKMIDTVGNARERFEEDSLRMLRALRFAVTLDFSLSNQVSSALRDPFVLERLTFLPVERVREELHKMFKHDTRGAMVLLCVWFPLVAETIFSHWPNLWLKPTTEER